MQESTAHGEPVKAFTLQEFIRATRPDGKGHIFFQGEEIASFDEVLCDCCNVEIKQPEDAPDKLVVFLWLDRAYCENCFKRWSK